MPLLGDGRSSISRTYQHYTREGLRSTTYAVLRQFGLSPRGYRYYFDYHLKRLRGVACVGEIDLFRPVPVNPQSIEYLPAIRFDKWENMGEIKGGNWDRPDGRFDDRRVVQSLSLRFEEGLAWKETKQVQWALEQVDGGASVWNGCRSRADVIDRCTELDRLYERIREDGYRSQTELHGTTYRALLLNGSFDRSRTEIAVHIGRNGELLFVDGTHRLTIAKVLGIDRIPVRVVIRHKEWERIRERVRETGMRGVPQCVRSHPDLRTSE